MIKTIQVILFCILIQSCGVKSSVESQNKNGYRIFKKEKFREYVFFHGKKDNDTLLFVAKNEDINDCKKGIKFIYTENLKTVSMIKSKTDTIVFNYFMRTTNGLKAMSGEYAPGDPKKIYLDSYWQYPYSFDCNSINSLVY